MVSRGRYEIDFRQRTSWSGIRVYLWRIVSGVRIFCRKLCQTISVGASRRAKEPDGAVLYGEILVILTVRKRRSYSENVTIGRREHHRPVLRRSTEFGEVHQLANQFYQIAYIGRRFTR